MGPNLADLLEMLKDEWGRGRASVISILQAEQSLRIAAKDSPIAPTGPDPTEWQNKRDWCLTHTAGLTGTQQDFLAELGRLGDPTPAIARQFRCPVSDSKRVRSLRVRKMA